ncbi:TCPH [Enterospora canceri]|uniref:CCT-eta n=1 Tax=Enterospora canceri TaxID=1081671 RepID=A0A1Y1S699_9MICR|nr:TCPH [Enterospora canceri]
MEGCQYLFKTEKVEDCRQGVSQIKANISVVESVADFVAKTLGPYGLDKLFYGKKMLLTNDGATIMENMEFKHPVAQLLTSLSKSQDQEVGDGTTSVIVLTGALLTQLKPLITADFSRDELRKVLNTCLTECIKHLDSLKVEFSEEKLVKLAETCMTSKNVRNERGHFAEMLCGVLNSRNKDFNLNVVKMPGGSLGDSVLVDGVAFEKTFTYAGYDQQPKRIEHPLIACIDVELEWKSEKENAEIRISSTEEYKKVVDAEYAILEEKLDDLIKSGANVVLSTKSVGDYATQYFAAKGVFSLGRVGDLDKICRAFGGAASTTTKYLSVGQADLFEERQLGNTRYNYISSSKTNVKTLILRGPGEEVVEEVERAIHDAVCVVKKAVSSQGILTGGGSAEMAMSTVCRRLYQKAEGREKSLYRAIGAAFEKIPVQLAENFGLDPIIQIQKLRKMHASVNHHYGMTLFGPADMHSIGVFEPVDVKKNMVKAAFSTVDVILSINGTLISENQSQ